MKRKKRKCNEKTKKKDKKEEKAEAKTENKQTNNKASYEIKQAELTNRDKRRYINKR